MSAQTSSPVNRLVPRLVRRGLVGAIGPVWRATHGVQVFGEERLPVRRGAGILACNHAAFVDTVHLAAIVRPRFVVIGAKPRLFRDPVRRGVMAVGNILRVDDPRQAARDAERLLADGQLLLAYPELGRFPDGLGPFDPWVAGVSIRTGVPILPLHLSGTGAAPGPVRLVVGEPLQPSGTPADLTAALRRIIEDLGR